MVRVRHDRLGDRTTIVGWDGRRAVVTSFLMVAMVLGHLACPFWEMPGWPWLLLALALLAIAGAGSGYWIVIDGRDVVLTKTWCAIPYRRLRFGRDCEIEVADDFDSGEIDGVLFCREGEVDERSLIGTGRDAIALAETIRDAIDRHRREPRTYRS